MGNHRGSIFRLLVGKAIAKRSNIPLPESWGVAARKLRVDGVAINEAEAGIEAPRQRVYRSHAVPVAERERRSRPQLQPGFDRT